MPADAKQSSVRQLDDPCLGAPRAWLRKTEHIRIFPCLALINAGQHDDPAPIDRQFGVKCMLGAIATELALVACEAQRCRRLSCTRDRHGNDAGRLPAMAVVMRARPDEFILLETLSLITPRRLARIVDWAPHAKEHQTAVGTAADRNKDGPLRCQLRPNRSMVFPGAPMITGRASMG